MSNELIPFGGEVDESRDLAVMDGETQIAKARVQQEIQAQVIMARQFPRDIQSAHRAIMQTCSRKNFCIDPKTHELRALYDYKRGKQITGPSIVLAKAIAQAWGNIDYGFRIIDQTATESTVETHGWDLETNTKATRCFTVKHVIGKKNAQGQVEDQLLTDSRSIYETIANQAMRRLRACILDVIPADIVDDAVEQVYRTLKKDDKPLEERIELCVQAFEKIGVSRKVIEAQLQKPVKQLTDMDVIRLRAAYAGISDGFKSVEQYFPGATTEGSLKERVAEAQPKAPKAPKKATPPKKRAPQHPPALMKVLEQLRVVLAEAETDEQITAIEKEFTSRLGDEDVDAYDAMMELVDQARAQLGVDL